MFSAHYSEPLIQIRARFAGSPVARHRCRSSVLRATHFGRGTTNWPTNARQIIVAAKQRFVHVLLYSGNDSSSSYIPRLSSFPQRERDRWRRGKAVKSKREGKVFIKLSSSRCFRLIAPVIIKNINSIAKYTFSQKILL